MPDFLRNSQLRLFLSGTLFSAAFVWMAITSYDVDEEEIRVFLILSTIVVGILILAGCLLGMLLMLLRKTRRREGLLGKIEEIEREVAASPEAERSTTTEKPEA